MDIKMPKRLCIYVIYDDENVIDDYIGYMLQELRQICSSLVVVCNSEYIQHGLANIQKNAERYFFRKNIGYDAGAYKDVLSKYIGWDRVKYYDEIILLNDSFYGPFSSWEQIFDTMKTVEADFWGMTRSRQGITTGGIIYKDHVQSYFLVFRKKVLHSIAFRNFWEQLKYPVAMEEAIQNFELGINEYLKQKGFRDAAITDLYGNLLKIEENKNPYLEYPLELIRDCKIPILKYKALSFGNSGYADALKAVRFMEEKRLYPIEYIRNHIRRKSKIGKTWIDFEKLEIFYETHQRIFIYGFGIYGKNLELYFRHRRWKSEGFLVTEATESVGGAIAFETVQLKEGDGIVVAVGKKEICIEIQEYLADRCKEEQILFPNF